MYLCFRVSLIKLSFEKIPLPRVQHHSARWNIPLICPPTASDFFLRDVAFGYMVVTVRELLLELRQARLVWFQDKGQNILSPVCSRTSCSKKQSSKGQTFWYKTSLAESSGNPAVRFYEVLLPLSSPSVLCLAVLVAENPHGCRWRSENWDLCFLLSSSGCTEFW